MTITKREAAILTLTTGVLIGSIFDAEDYAEEITGNKSITHDRLNELKYATRPDFYRLLTTVEGFEMTDSFKQVCDDEGIELDVS